MAQTNITTYGHGNSMTELVQSGQFSKNVHFNVMLKAGWLVLISDAKLCRGFVSVGTLDKGTLRSPPYLNTLNNYSWFGKSYNIQQFQDGRAFKDSKNERLIRNGQSCTYSFNPSSVFHSFPTPSLSLSSTTGNCLLISITSR